jgi:hypothetical protein
MRNKTHTDIQTLKKKSCGREGCMFLMGNVSTYLSQSLFYRSVQGKDSDKNQASIILDAR